MHSRFASLARLSTSAGLCLLAALVSLLAPARAWAIEYEVFIDVDSEDELYDLWVSDQIDDDTFQTLVEIQRRGVDLNHATRAELYSLPNLTYDDVDAILAYREEVGVIRSPADLLAAEVLSERKLGSILMFIEARPEKPKLTATHGWIRYQTAWSQEDSTVPPMALQARITTLRQLTVGVAGLLTRQRVGDAIWDPNREALLAPAPRPRAYLPKYFVQWETDRFGVIAGTYRVGFGQRLTFDNTTRYTPNGFYLDDAIYRSSNDLTLGCREGAGELGVSPCADDGRRYVSRDFSWRDGLRGVAIGAKHLSLPVGWMQLYGFGSWQNRQIYQYQVYNADRCEDPRIDSDDVPACAAPQLYSHDPGDELLARKSSNLYNQLTNSYDELLGGGNMSWFYNRRTHVGVTGYGAVPYWRIGGAKLDFRDYASTPFGGPWGAIGADMAWGYRWSDLAVEVARSFDSMRPAIADGPDPDYGGGGFAGIVRQTSTFGDGDQELELSARWYGRGYANPYAGPIAQPDQFGGNRARDEVGGRARYRGRILDRLDLRAQADAWYLPSRDLPRFAGYVRGDVDVTEWFRPGLWLEYRNNDLAGQGRGTELQDDNFFFTPDANLACVGPSGLVVGPDGGGALRSRCFNDVGKITGRLVFRPIPRKPQKLAITAQYQHEVGDDPRLDGRPRQDGQATLIVRTNPIRSFRIAGRLRYLNEDIMDNHRYEESLWTYVELSYVFAKVFETRLRYDTYVWLDQRDNTLIRLPNPEHRLRLILEARF